jgi:hypothetical protein
MVIVEFYTYTDDTKGLDELGYDIVKRFKQDYPEATSEVNYNQDEELFSIIHYYVKKYVTNTNFLFQYLVTKVL